MVTVTAVFARLLSPRTGAIKGVLAENPQGWANRLRNLWFPTVVAIPLALALLTLLGYSYAAGTMFQVLVETAWLAENLERPDLRILRDPFSAKPHVLFYANKRVGGDVTDFSAIKLLRVSV